jgi:hypothetical protein
MQRRQFITSKSRATIVSCGIAMVLLGSGYLFSESFKNAILFVLAILAAGLVFLYFGFSAKADGLKVVGTLITGISLTFFIIRNFASTSKITGQIGLGLFVFGLCWISTAVVLGGIKSTNRLWPLIPAGILLPVSILLMEGSTSLLHFVLAGCLGLGISLFLWGLINKWIGLVIPGCILITAGPGIFFAWRSAMPANALSQTGTMLVWFAVGWVLIAVASRFLFSQVIWWPFIPAGVLAFVGWGLALGGNASLAKSLIGNSGSIIVILLGFYLLLIRQDIHK